MEQVLRRDCVDAKRRADISNLLKLNNPVTKTADYTLLESDSGNLFHDSTNAVTFTLPITLNIGWWCIVKHLANTTITIAAGAGGTVNGAASLAAANTQDPAACALVIKTSAADFSCFLIGTWT